jgi:1-pyrroline-5-carboxylate dehydrogenase
MTAENCKLSNLVGGVWTSTIEYEDLIDPMNGNIIGKVPLTQKEETKPFIDSLLSVPKYGLHNPLYNPERYLLYGDVCHKAANLLRQKEVETFFTRLI